MNTTIIIETIDGILRFEESITFSPVELPYGGIGFGVNGSSTAEENDLSAYWSFIKSKLVNTSDYITLKSITHNNVFYGVTD
jgi:hypothetical protein